MTEFTSREALAHVADVAPPPAIPEANVRSEIDRSFELPTGLYIATVGLYLGFLAVMAATFMNAGLVLPMAIFALFVVAAFGTPMLWARMKPDSRQQPLTWGAFRNRGIQIATGRLDAGGAAVQVLILPVLIFVWGISVAVIAALT